MFAVSLPANNCSSVEYVCDAKFDIDDVKRARQRRIVLFLYFVFKFETMHCKKFFSRGFYIEGEQ